MWRWHRQHRLESDVIGPAARTRARQTGSHDSHKGLGLHNGARVVRMTRGRRGGWPGGSDPCELSMSSTWSGHGLPRPPVRALVVPASQRRWAHSSHQRRLLKAQSPVSAAAKTGTASGGGDRVMKCSCTLPGEEMRQVGQKGTGVRVPPGVSVHTP